LQRFIAESPEAVVKGLQTFGTASFAEEVSWNLAYPGTSPEKIFMKGKNGPDFFISFLG
jgi:hypothetical protein